MVFPVTVYGLHCRYPIAGDDSFGGTRTAATTDTGRPSFRAGSIAPATCQRSSSTWMRPGPVLDGRLEDQAYRPESAARMAALPVPAFDERPEFGGDLLIHTMAFSLLGDPSRLPPADRRRLLSHAPAGASQSPTFSGTASPRSHPLLEESQGCSFKTLCPRFSIDGVPPSGSAPHADFP